MKSCLDEHNLELRVKTANEAEAISQQKLAAAEAEIAELRHKLEASKRLQFTCFFFFILDYLLMSLIQVYYFNIPFLSGSGFCLDLCKPAAIRKMFI